MEMAVFLFGCPYNVWLCLLHFVYPNRERFDQLCLASAITDTQHQVHPVADVLAVKR